MDLDVKFLYSNRKDPTVANTNFSIKTNSNTLLMQRLAIRFGKIAQYVLIGKISLNGATQFINTPFTENIQNTKIPKGYSRQ